MGGGVWIVMSVRRNKEDHDRLDTKIDDLRKETREEFKEVRLRLDRILERLPPPQ